jgi:hypothetical protein
MPQGSPRLWSPSPSTKRLKEDSGEYFRDPNATRYSRYEEKVEAITTSKLTFPSYPTEPAFRALLTLHPDANLLSFDIVGYRSTLRNLLRFCAGIEKDFRFNINRVRDTIFFIRKERSPIALIPNIYGYGHSFPKAHIIWEPDVKGSASH